MSNIRRQSIISSGVVYFGFALGFLNTYLFTREGSGFTKEAYGLVNVFVALGNIMYSFANLGMTAYINKFFPYYKENVEDRKSDLITWALLTSFIGFLMVVAGGWIFKDLVIRKYGTNAPDLVKYYRWVFPFGMGLTFFSLLEAFSWHLKKVVLTNFLREVLFRLFTTILILFFGWGMIRSYDVFIKTYALTYLLLAAILLLILRREQLLHFNLTPSKVTQKFKKKIVALASFFWSGTLVYSISSVFDTLIIAAVMPNGLAFSGIYSLAQNIASLIQAPQRGIVSSSIAALSQAWKQKDMERIDRIYHRSSINQILFSVGMFILIWLNFKDGVYTFHLQKDYLLAQEVFLFIGLMRMIDMGTGVNAQIIATSIFWKFEFLTGILLLLLTLPMNYMLTKYFGVTGPAISNLISFTIYNAIRYYFLYKKFRLQPFRINALYAIFGGVISYFICAYLFQNYHGFWAMTFRSSAFILLYGGMIVGLKLTPDLKPVIDTVRKKLNVQR